MYFVLYVHLLFFLENRGVKRILYVLYVEMAFASYHRHYIETHRSFKVVQFDIGVGSSHDMAYLLPIHGLVGLAELSVAPSFHFNKHQRSVFGGYNVEFEAVLPPVTVKYGVSLSNQIVHGSIFACLSENIGCCHIACFL